jgi:hypothetical protein
VYLQKSSTSGQEISQRLLEVQSVNGFHQDVDSQSTIRPNGSGLNHITTPAQLMRPVVSQRKIDGPHAGSGA